MKRVARFLMRSVIATTFGGAALLWSGEMPLQGETVQFASGAQAWVGAPATPRSFAGVARRTTARAVAVGTAAGVATVGTARAVTVGATTARAVAVGTTAAVSASRCVRVIGPLGRTALVCR
jgi:hypothetical protein